MIKFLRKIRGLRWVYRWNFHPRVGRESVAEHSFYAAVYAMALSQLMGRGERFTYEVTVAALLHDAEESITGDLPALVKRYCNWKPVVEQAQMELFGGLTGLIRDAHMVAETIDVIKAADLLDALVYAHEECEMGNKNFERIRRELIGSLDRVIVEGEQDLGGAIQTLLTGLGFDRRDGVSKPQEMSHL